MMTRKFLKLPKNPFFSVKKKIFPSNDFTSPQNGQEQKNIYVLYEADLFPERSKKMFLNSRIHIIVDLVEWELFFMRRIRKTVAQRRAFAFIRLIRSRLLFFLCGIPESIRRIE